MTPTEINILLVVLATAFGFAIRHAWAKFYLDKDAVEIIDGYEASLIRAVRLLRGADIQKGAAFNTGFIAGVKMADDEEAEDELEEEVSFPLTANLKRFQPIFPSNEEIASILARTTSIKTQ